MRTRLKKRKDQKGYVIAFVVVTLGAMLTIMGFAVDVGAWYFNASKLQRAADAAALSGAISLPKEDEAGTAVDDSLKKNELIDGGAGGSIAVTKTVTHDRVTVTVRDNAVPTYFTSAFIDSITIERHSEAIRETAIPALGSPYNILGAGGDLELDGAVENRGFWLAINGECSPAEDGDYFNARWDANKGPYTSDVDDNGFYIPEPEAEYVCDDTQPDNGNRDAAGYSYFVDVPAPAAGQYGSVWLRVYDGSWHPNSGVARANDSNLFVQGETPPHWATNFSVYNTHGDPDNEGRQEKVNTVRIEGYDGRQEWATAVPGWVDLYEIPYEQIAEKGGQYRIQVTTDRSDGYGINNFALGAFRGWADWTDCDSRDDSDCPRVYTRRALSITNNTANDEKKPKVYLAELDASYVGTPFQIYMWDPGEGVKSINLLAPDDTKLKFEWHTADHDYDSAGTKNKIDTSGTGAKAIPGAGLSNGFRFNDRLLVLDVTLPANYQHMIDKADGSTWLKLQYNIEGSAPQDRTTLGVQLTGDTFGPARLVRPE